MPLKEPGWWYQNRPEGPARLLSPVAHIWGRIAANRLKYARPYTSLIPVICIGNFTAGGTGKTPLTILLTNYLKGRGETPAILTRGYGGSLKGPHLVDPTRDRARETGDEALLLAQYAPTIVSRDRREGAQFIEKLSDPPSVIVMDDGMQNPSLAKMLRLAVVDARRGLGNGLVIPSGPLRAPLDAQLDIADAIIINAGPAEVGDVPRVPGKLILQFRQSGFHGPILRGGIVPRTDLATFRNKRILAFAGIGNPERFFETLKLNGLDIAESVAFKDHHFFDAGDAERLLKRAKALNAQLVTTDKDLVRLKAFDDPRGELARLATPFQIEMALTEPDMLILDDLIQLAIQPADLIAEELVRSVEL